jgi:hypothetical protein
MNYLQKHFSKSLIATAALLVCASPALAQVPLGAASGFAVLAVSAVTCTSSTVTGDVGVSPGTGFTNTGCTFSGATPPASTAAAVDAHTAFVAAYTALRAGVCTQTLSSLDGLNLPPGIYCVDGTAKTGALTLTGAADAAWTFLVTGALTGTNFSVAMAGGAQASNVFWAPTGAATMTTSVLQGNILAGDATSGSITLTGGTLNGRALANVAVTMTGVGVVGSVAPAIPAPVTDPICLPPAMVAPAISRSVSPF